MKIKYKVKKITKRIFAIIVENNFDRAMLFLRVSEFYESKKFKGKQINIWEFIREYSSGGNFTYATDWDGFNLPAKTAKNCINDLYKKNSDDVTPYDTIMANILVSIPEDAYIIGVKSLDDTLFHHELRHAFYYTNEEYKDVADEVVRSIPKKNLKIIKSELTNLGYHPSVFTDEIQAYFSTETLPVIAVGIMSRESNDIYKSFSENLDRFFYKNKK